MRHEYHFATLDTAFSDKALSMARPCKQFFTNVKFIAGLMLCLVALTAQSDDAVMEFSAVYDAKVKILGGKIEMSTRANDDNEYTFSYEVIPGKFASLFTDGVLKETTKFDLQEGRPRTLHYELVNTIGSNPRNAIVDFDWDNKQVTGSYRKRPVNIEMPPNAVDRAALQALLMADLRNDSLRTEYAIYNKDEFETVLVERKGTETIKVPAGTFSTIILHHKSSDGDSETFLWCAEELGFLPVRIQSKDEGKTVLNARLKTFTRHTAG